MKPIGEILFNVSETRKDYEAAKKEAVDKAVELGLPEKLINNNHQVAIAYLRGFLKGKQ